MDHWAAQLRAYLKREVRTRRKDYEQYMSELAVLYRQVCANAINEDAYEHSRAELERRYASRINHDDCITCADLGEYQRFINLLRAHMPELDQELQDALHHEQQHAAALEHHDGIEWRYGLWLLHEDDRSLALAPCIEVQARGVQTYLEARRVTVGLPDELSPFDELEDGD